MLLLVAYAIYAADGCIEYKHQVMPDILGRVALPMDGDEVRYLLRHDTYVVKQFMQLHLTREVVAE